MTDRAPQRRSKTPAKTAAGAPTRTPARDSAPTSTRTSAGTSARTSPRTSPRTSSRTSPRAAAPATTRRAAPPSADTRQRDNLLLLATVVLTIIVYATSLGNDFVDFDDPENVLDNYSIRELNLTNLGHYFSTPLQYMYTPLVYISYAIDFQIGGLDPTAYHVTNLLLHLGNTVLVFLFLRTLTRRSFVSHVVTVAFAIHPMNVDGVAWISTRSGLLATLFSLGALLAYTHYVRTGRMRFLAIASALFLFATFSKSPAVVLPLTLFLIDYYRRRRLSWRLLLEKIPFFAIALTMGIVALNYRVDTVNPYGYTILDRFFIVCSALVAYLGKLVFPFGLSFAHAYPPKDGAFLPWYLYLSPVALVLLAWLLYRDRRARRVIVFGLSFFLVTIVLSQTVLLIDNFQANRYAYLPYLGLFFILAHFTDRLVNGKEMRQRRPRLRTTATAVLAAVVLVFASLSLLRNRAWHDTNTIMTNSIENEPGVAFVYNSRGIARYKAGDHAGAKVDFEQTLSLDPDFILSYYYLGIMKHLSGDYAGALVDLDRVVARYPGFAAGYNERGKAKLELKDSTGALDDFAAAISLDSFMVDAYYNRGVVELERGELPAAVADFDRAIDLFADFADAYHRRGEAKSRLGDTQGACGDWDTARSLGNQEAVQAFSATCPPR